LHGNFWGHTVFVTFFHGGRKSLRRVRIEMFRRTAALFELAADRAGWARGAMR
jgi:hypothetical protein